jgi:hypothetical protein
MKQNKPNPYIDEIFHGKGQDYDSHLHIVGEIFTQLLEAGMQVNLSKSKLCATQVEFLGFLLKKTGFHSKSYHLAISRKYEGFLE